MFFIVHSLGPDPLACILQAGVAWGMFMGSYDAVKEGALSTFQSSQLFEFLFCLQSFFVVCLPCVSSLFLIIRFTISMWLWSASGHVGTSRALYVVSGTLCFKIIFLIRFGICGHLLEAEV